MTSHPSPQTRTLRAEQLIAHRGYQRHYPENSPLAIRQAIACGARYIEVDVQFSADGVPLLYHDADLLRISGREGRLMHYHFPALRGMSAGEPGRLGDQFKDVHIAPLQTLVDILRQYPHVQALVELKEDGVRDHGIAKCLGMLRETLAPVIKQCVLISFDLDALRAARADGFQRLGPILRDWNLRFSICDELQPEMIICNYQRIPVEETISMDHCAVALYEVDDQTLALQLLARGASFIETFAIGEMLGTHEKH